MLLESRKIKVHKWGTKDHSKPNKIITDIPKFIYCINNCWRPTEKDQKQIHTLKLVDAKVKQSVLSQQYNNFPHIY